MDQNSLLIIEKIAEVKTYFNNHKKELENNYEKIRSQKPPASDGPAFLFGAHTPATDEELRTAVPAKPEVDKLITRSVRSLNDRRKG